jgi:hypothetical protein
MSFPIASSVLTGLKIPTTNVNLKKTEVLIQCVLLYFISGKVYFHPSSDIMKMWLLSDMFHFVQISLLTN